MPTKPPFDPKIHLINPDKNPSDRSSSSHESTDILASQRRASNDVRKAERKKESKKSDRKKESRRARRRGSNDIDDDEALARKMQEQILEEEMGGDEEMQSLQQRELMGSGSTSPSRDSRKRLEGSSKSSSNRKSGPSRSHKSSSERSRGGSTGEEDPDEALARRIQDEVENGPRTTLTQEQEDAALARMMAESGESFSNIDRQRLSLEAARMSMPGAHHVAVPAGMPRELMGRRMAGNALSASLVEEPGKTPTYAAIPIPGHRSKKSDTLTHATPSRALQQNYQEEYVAETAAAFVPSNMPGVNTDALNPDLAAERPGRSKRRSRKKDKVITATAVPAPMERILNPERSKPKIPIVIRGPSSSKQGPVPYSIQGTQLVPIPIERNAEKKKKAAMSLPTKKSPICAACEKPASNYVIALDKKYHIECFRCAGCDKLIDSTGPFAFTTNDSGDKSPLHKECFSELYGVKCSVCRKSIPPGPDGKVSFVKHPFFESEKMCPSHAANPGRRCTACHRFEPQDAPFADLGDMGRVTCYSCCSTVVVDGGDAEPLWDDVIDFFDNKLELPVWPDMRDVPILIVGYKALNEQMKQTGCAHIGSSATMARGVCLTEHQSGRKVPLAAMKFNRAKKSFEKSSAAHENGFTYFQVPDAHKVNPDSSVTCILCLSGLPKELTASVLAHEAAHAWIKLHPRYDHDNPLPPQVEEGCAQLIALLFLTDGLPPASDEPSGDGGPSQQQLREYFKFSIETDKNEIYGEGYRKAAEAYSAIGIEALMAHVVLYKEFPTI